MKRLTILNRIHKDLVIPINEAIHKIKYSNVMNELNNFIQEYWKDVRCIYSYRSCSMFNWRNYNFKYTDIFHWNFKKIQYSIKYDKLPSRYIYTTTKWEVKDVKLIKK